MAAGLKTISVRFGGDATDLKRETKAAEDSVEAMTSGIGNAVSRSNEKIEGSINKFRGSADIVDGLSTAMEGFGATLPGPIGGILNVTRGVADLADGFSTALAPALEKAAAKFGIKTAATTADTVATEGATAAQKGLNLAFLTSPIGIFIAALAALVAGFVIAYQKSETFRNIVNGVMSAVRNAFEKSIGAIVNVVRGAFNWISDRWPLLLAILTGPVGLAVLAISKHFDRIKDAASSIVNAIRKIFDRVTDAITAPFRAAVDGLRSAWNSTIGGKGIHIPEINLGFTKIGGGGFEIPYLAKGGPLDAGQMAIVGERGPELFVPNSSGRVVPNGAPLTVEIHATGPTLQDIVDVKIREANRASYRAVAAGARRAY